MRVLLTGATGFIGRACVLRLLRDGHDLTALVRDPTRARDQLGADVDLVPIGTDVEIAAAVAGQEAIVNLAGEPIVAERWTDERKQLLVHSRVDLTRRLATAVRALSDRPRVLVSASAVGYYGPHRNTPTDEQAEPGADFLADLCRRWEREAWAVEPHGVRVALLRIGLVIGREGGFLEPMLPLFRKGLGGTIGLGKAPVPWVHLDDVAEVVAAALTDEAYAGPINVTAPELSTNADLTRELGQLLSRPTVLPVPPPALRVVFGQAAEAIVGGVAAVPERLSALGHPFLFPTLRGALADVLDTSAVRIERSSEPLESDYLRARRPTHQLSTSDLLAMPLGEVLPFFQSPENLGLITPPWMSFRIRTPRPIEMKEGTVIDYDVRVAGGPRRWRTVIERWEPGRGFVDAQHEGPYRCWWHEHRFEAEGQLTRMDDRVRFAVPYGPLGLLVNKTWVSGMLRRIFSYRRGAMRLRFRLGGVPQAER